MELVLDANILFAALIKHGKTIELFLDLRLHLFGPDFLLVEFEKYKNTIIKKSHKNKQEFEEIFKQITKVLNIVSKEKFKDKFDEAKKISPDSNDAPYFALSLKLKCPIWSNDTLLKKQNKIKVYSTTEMLKII